MKIFALETNEEKLRASILQKGETVVRSTGFHPCLFWFHVIDDILQTFVIIAIAWVLMYFGANVVFVSILALISFLYFIVGDISQSLIDYLSDEIIITNKRVIYVNQGNIWRREIKEMDLENIASVTAKTQYLNIFPFGILHFDLKEGVGKSLTFRYVPHVQQVSGCISQCLISRQEASQISL